MDDLNLGLDVSDDRRSAKASLTGAEGGAAEIELTTAQLMQVMGLAMAARAQMEPPIAAEPPEQLPVLQDPILKAVSHGGGKLLAFRHPGLGWLGFSLTADGARQLGEFLLRIETEAPPSLQ